jgi:uncharacterized protein YcbK (DUF882 family)
MSLVSAVCLMATQTSTAKADDINEWLAASFTAGPSASSRRRDVSFRSGRSNLGRFAGEERRSNRGHRRGGVRVASLGSASTFAPSGPSISGGIRWAASAGCLDSALRSIVAGLSSFGQVTVNSTCRSRRHNARVGGAHRSYHLSGNAVDFRIRGNVRGAYAYLRSSGSIGGLKHYGGGLFHIDTGPRRSW